MAVLICLSFVAAVFVIFTHSTKSASLLQVQNLFLPPDFPPSALFVSCHSKRFPDAWGQQAQLPPPMMINGIKYVAVAMPAPVTAKNAPMLALPRASATRVVARKSVNKVNA